MSLEQYFEDYLKKRYLGYSYTDIEKIFEETYIENTLNKEELVALYIENAIECNGILAQHCLENDINRISYIDLNRPAFLMMLAFRCWKDKFKLMFFNHYKLPNEFKRFKHLVTFTQTGLELDARRIDDKEAFREKFIDKVGVIGKDFMYKGVRFIGISRLLFPKKTITTRKMKRV